MANPFQKQFTRFLKWRYRHISNKTFTHILAVAVGLLAGLASVVLKNLTFFIESSLENGIVVSSNQLYFILPIIGLTLVYLYVKYVHKEKLEHAVSSILYSLSKKKGLISFKKIYTPLVTAPLTVGFGGSVGLLGPAVASGSAISSNLATALHLNSKTRSLLIACASAGAVASIFQSPIAAIIFAVEIFSIDFTISRLCRCYSPLFLGYLPPIFF